MNSYEVPAIIEDALPDIKDEWGDKNVLGNINATMLVLVKYTRKMMHLHNLPAVVRCMRLADKIYNKGNDLVKNAVENVFVYAFSGIKACCDAPEWRRVQAGMPITLYSIYVRQIYRSGI